MVNSSTLPNFSYKTQTRISDFEIKEDNILLIIKNLNRSKAHGSDVSIHMIQLCGKSIVKPLKYLSESFLTAGILLEDRKKGNIIPSPQKRKQGLYKKL